MNFHQIMTDKSKKISINAGIFQQKRYIFGKYKNRKALTKSYTMEQDVQFKHVTPVQIRFSDVDQYGHMNNSVYFFTLRSGKDFLFPGSVRRERMAGFQRGCGQHKRRLSGSRILFRQADYRNCRNSFGAQELHAPPARHQPGQRRAEMPMPYRTCRLRHRDKRTRRYSFKLQESHLRLRGENA